MFFSLVLNTSKLQFHFDSHPDVTEVEEKSLEQRLWIALAEAGVLFGPGVFSIRILNLVIELFL